MLSSRIFPFMSLYQIDRSGGNRSRAPEKFGNEIKFFKTPAGRLTPLRNAL
jgi:hypothetical protein